MKKIVALALCLIMALSLCTVAFAADDQYDLYVANDSNLKDTATVKDGKTPAFDGVALTTMAAKKNSDGSGNLEYMATGLRGMPGTNYFVKTTTPTVSDYAVCEDGKTAVLFYVTSVNYQDYEYAAEAEAFTDFGFKCGQVNSNATGFNTKIDYYKITKTSTADLAKSAVYGEATTGVNVLVGNEIVTVGTTAMTKIQHQWTVTGVKLDEKNNTVPTEVYCPVCGAKSTAIYKDGKSPAGSEVENVPGYDAYEFVVTAATTTTTTTGVSSAKTFDAGIALYVGMSISAVAGSAVVIGKKKEF